MVQSVRDHYERVWGAHGELRSLNRGPAEHLALNLKVLVFPPRPDNGMWTYATVGMSQAPEAGQSYGLELHLFSRQEDDGLVGLLTAVACYHVTTAALGWGHTVYFGRPWLPFSTCSYGLISLLYLDGPKLEWMGPPERSTRFLWLIPITGAERNFVIEQDSVEPLERLFEETEFNYLDPKRPSVV
jgi:hypothetical protein